MAVVTLCKDLIFATKIRSTGEALGCPVRTCLGPRQLGDVLAEPTPPALILVDLNAEGVDVAGAIRQCKAARPDVPVIAFVSHVQVDLAQAADQAGADQVLPRSKFVQVLPSLLERAKTVG